MNIHANARLTLRARRDVVELMIVGYPVNEIAAQFSVLARPFTSGGRAGVRRATQACGTVPAGRSRCPHQTSRALEWRIEQIRRLHKRGPARIGPHGGLVDLDRVRRAHPPRIEPARVDAPTDGPSRAPYSHIPRR